MALFTKRTPAARLTPWLKSYFDQLKATYQQFPQTGGAEDDILRTIVGKADSELSASDVLLLDQLVLARKSYEQLRAEAPLLRVKFEETVGNRVFQAYTPANPKVGADGDDAHARTEMLADLSTIVYALHTHYALRRHMEGLQTTIARTARARIIVYAISWAVGVLIAQWWLNAPGISVLLSVVYVGIMGGFISTLRRVQSIDSELDPFLIVETLNGFKESALDLAPLLGGVFAFVLMMIFMSGLISGTLFPVFQPVTTESAWTFKQLASWTPDGSVNFTKLLVWAFLAGFAERLVPDALDRLVQRGSAVVSPHRQDTVTAPPPPTATRNTATSVPQPTAKHEVSPRPPVAGDEKPPM